jgi:hypothetical protein
VVPFPVLQFAVQHGPGNLQDVLACVVEQGARVGHPGHRGRGLLLVLGSLADLPGGRVRDAFGVVQHCRGHAVQLRVGGQWRGDDVRPAAEPDQGVHLHRHEPFQPVRHQRHFDPEQFFRDGRGELVGGVQRGLRLPQEHRAVDLEVVVVRPVQRVEVHGTTQREELLVGRDRGGVRGHHPPVVAAQHVEMRRHVPQVARVRDQFAQPVSRLQRVLRPGRHLHQMDVQVQYTGVIPALRVGQRPVQHGLGLDRGRAVSGLPGDLVPQGQPPGHRSLA